MIKMETTHIEKRLEIGAVSKLGYLLPANFDFSKLFTNETFEIYQPLTDDESLVYTCQFQDFERAEYLYLKANQADEADNISDWLEWVKKLNRQPIDILEAEIR